MNNYETGEKAPGRLIPFTFDGTHIRTFSNMATGELFLCLSDLLKAQGTTTWPNQVLPEVIEIFGDNQKIVLPIQDALGRFQDVIFISDHAAIYIVSKGRTDTSKRLNRWIFAEVIPSVRKTGKYAIPAMNADKPYIAICDRYKTAKTVVKTCLETGRALKTEPVTARYIAVQEALKASGIDFSSLLPNAVPPSTNDPGRLLINHGLMNNRRLEPTVDGLREILSSYLEDSGISVGKTAEALSEGLPCKDGGYVFFNLENLRT
jgi:prophage antirepressor-like protein